MACGDTLRTLLRTSDGRTPDDPCGAVCWEGDEWEWAQTVNSITRRVEAEADNLKRISEASYTDYAAMTSSYLTDAEAVPSRFGSLFGGGGFGAIRERVNRIIAVGQEGICVLEQLSAAVKIAGGRPLASPGAGGQDKSWMDSAASLFLVVGVVGGLWWFSQKRGASS